MKKMKSFIEKQYKKKERGETNHIWELSTRPWESFVQKPIFFPASCNIRDFSHKSTIISVSGCG
jgi:hypothetical protein